MITVTISEPDEEMTEEMAELVRDLLAERFPTVRSLTVERYQKK